MFPFYMSDQGVLVSTFLITNTAQNTSLGLNYFLTVAMSIENDSIDGHKCTFREGALKNFQPFGHMLVYMNKVHFQIIGFIKTSSTVSTR